MPRKQADVEAALERKGFKPRPGDHNYFTYYSFVGKKTRVFTKTSHGNRELNDYLLAQMAKQCALGKSDFALLVECPMDRASYESKLISQSLVEAPPPDAESR